MVGIKINDINREKFFKYFRIMAIDFEFDLGKLNLNKYNLIKLEKCTVDHFDEKLKEEVEFH